MNKVLVELHIPATGDRFDTFVPVDVPIKDLIGVFAGGVAEITNGKYVVSGSEHLCMKESTGLLNPRLSLKDYGVKNGMRLYLV